MRCSHLCSNANTGTYPRGETGARWDREPCVWGSRAALSPSHNTAAALLLKPFPEALESMEGEREAIPLPLGGSLNNYHFLILRERTGLVSL